MIQVAMLAKWVRAPAFIVVIVKSGTVQPQVATFAMFVGAAFHLARVRVRVGPRLRPLLDVGRACSQRIWLGVRIDQA